MIITRVNKAWQPFYTGVKSRINWLINLKVIPFLKLCNIHTGLAVAGIVGPIFLTVGDLSAGIASPGYSIIQNSISSLALTNIGWLQTIGFLVLGLLVEIFTAGLLFNMKPAKRFYLGIAIFVFFGFAMLLIGAFRTDPIGVTRTIEGRIHGFAASASFLLFPVAILCLLSSIKRDPNWAGFYRYSYVSFILAVALVVSVMFLPDTNFIFGLIERVLVGNAILWVEIAAVNIFVISLKRKAQTRPV
ncbi:MAG: DUF998 domain-containing protein [Dehalococcoidales bacterium]